MKRLVRIVAVLAVALSAASAGIAVAQAAPVTYKLKAAADRYAIYNNSRNGLVMVNNVTSWNARLTSSYIIKNNKGLAMVESFTSVYRVAQYYYANYWYDSSTHKTRNIYSSFPFTFRGVKSVVGGRGCVTVYSYSHPAFKVVGTVTAVSPDPGLSSVTLHDSTGHTRIVYLMGRSGWTEYHDSSGDGQLAQDWATSLSPGDEVALSGVVENGSWIAYAGAK